MNKFEELITSLGSVLKIPLQAENGLFCALNIKGLLQVQIEYQENKEQVVLASFLCELPPGKFRENAMIEALKSNATEDAFGVFSYLSKINSLTLQLYLPIEISPEDLGNKLQQFIEKGTLWKEAIEKGNLSLVAKPSASTLISPFKLI